MRIRMKTIAKHAKLCDRNSLLRSDMLCMCHETNSRIEPEFRRALSKRIRKNTPEVASPEVYTGIWTVVRRRGRVTSWRRRARRAIATECVLVRDTEWQTRVTVVYCCRRTYVARIPSSRTTVNTTSARVGLFRSGSQNRAPQSCLKGSAVRFAIKIPIV